MLPSKLAFVDIETTGTRSTWDRVIEIGIVKTDNGELIDTYSTLINPQASIPPEIEQMTGIRSQDLESAPTFREVAGDILMHLRDYTFVAHNVRFDYGFLKAEFARLGASFSPRHFCTVRLSRTLFPRHKRHNLDSIIERFEIKCENRHRALGDALAIQTFYDLAKKQVSPEIFEAALGLVLKKPYLPVKLNHNILDKLPETPGVYIFYGKSEYQNSKSETNSNDQKSKTKIVSNFDIRASNLNESIPLYIGKSVNIRDRVLSHFAGDIHSPLEMKIAQQVESLEAIETAGELGALLLESHLIKTKLPIYNKMLRTKQELIALRSYTDSDGYLCVSLNPVTQVKPDELDSYIGFFRSRRQARDYLANLAKENSLCEKLLELEKTTTSCFGYRLERCKGACVKKELPLAYNMRFIGAFSKKPNQTLALQRPDTD